MLPSLIYAFLQQTTLLLPSSKSRHSSNQNKGLSIHVVIVQWSVFSVSTCQLLMLSWVYIINQHFIETRTISSFLYFLGSPSCSESLLNVPISQWSQSKASGGFHIWISLFLGKKNCLGIIWKFGHSLRISLNSGSPDNHSCFFSNIYIRTGMLLGACVLGLCVLVSICNDVLPVLSQSPRVCVLRTNSRILD